MTRGGIALTTVAVVLIAALTLGPNPGTEYLSARTPIWCLVCGDRGLVDVLLNVALFAPLGLGLRLAGLSTARTVALGAALSFSVESAQYFSIAGRDASLSDLLTNTTGTLVGAWLATLWRTVALPTPTLARRFAAATAAIWLAQLALTSWALTPKTHVTPQYWGQWAHKFPDTDVFRGTVRSAVVDDMPIIDAPLANTAALIAALDRPPVVMNVRITGGLRTNLRSQIVAVADGENGVAAVMQQEDCLFTFGVRLRAANLRLAQPNVALRLPCRASLADSLLLRGVASPQALDLSADDGARSSAQRLTLAPTMGWALLVPLASAYADVGLWNALWCAAFLLPLAYWLGRGTRLGGALVWLAGITMAGLWGIPRLFDRLPIGWREWAGAAVAASLGWGLAWVSLRWGGEEGSTPP